MKTKTKKSARARASKRVPRPLGKIPGAPSNQSAAKITAGFASNQPPTPAPADPVVAVDPAPVKVNRLVRVSR